MARLFSPTGSTTSRNQTYNAITLPQNIIPQPGSGKLSMIINQLRLYIRRQQSFDARFGQIDGVTEGDFTKGKK
jgi:hypothetical protein